MPLYALIDFFKKLLSKAFFKNPDLTHAPISTALSYTFKMALFSSARNLWTTPDFNHAEINFESIMHYFVKNLDKLAVKVKENQN